MLWFIVWTVLVLLALVVLGMLAWRVVRAGLALLAELGTAAERLDALATQVEHLSELRQEQPAVFEDPALLRRERDRARRERERRRAREARRRSRSVGTTPGAPAGL